MAVLAISQPGGRIEPHALGSGRFSIGRAAGNDLVVESPFVSREHAVLTPESGGYAIQDLGSRNGTWVNGKRIAEEEVTLRSGDRIQLGRSGVLLHYLDDDATLNQESPIGFGLPFAGLGMEVAWVGGRWQALLRAAPGSASWAPSWESWPPCSGSRSGSRASSRAEGLRSVSQSRRISSAKNPRPFVLLRRDQV